MPFLGTVLFVSEFLENLLQCNQITWQGSSQFCVAVFPHLNALPHLICISFPLSYLFFTFSFTACFHVFADEKLALQTTSFSLSEDLFCSCLLPRPFSAASLSSASFLQAAGRLQPTSQLVSALCLYSLSSHLFHPSSFALEVFTCPRPRCVRDCLHNTLVAGDGNCWRWWHLISTCHFPFH